MELNQYKCEHVRLHAIRRIEFENGGEVPVAQSDNQLHIWDQIFNTMGTTTTK